VSCAFRPGRRAKLAVERAWFLTLCLIAICSAVALVGCAPKPTAPQVQGPARTPPYTSDYPFAWTPDGQSFAFRRVVRSDAGPPGIYLARIGERRPRFLFTANILWPQHGSFSSDGNRLLLSYRLELFVVDIRDGAAWNPFFTGNGADFPAWVRGDTAVFYARVFGSIGQPEDSLGIHVFGLSSRTDRVLRSEGQVVNGGYICCSQIDGRVAFKNLGPSGHRILVGRPDGSGLETLYQGAPLHYVADLQWWVDPVRGRNGVVFSYGTGAGYPPFFFQDVNEAPLKPVPNLIGPFERISPDGKRYLTTGVAPGDSVVTVFIRDMVDPIGRPPVQVTWWSPP